MVNDNENNNQPLNNDNNNYIENDTKAELMNKILEYRKKRVLIPIICAVLLVFAGVMFAVRSQLYQYTDEAFVEGHILQVASNVSGQVINLYVDNNQEVKQNQLLLEIDPTDYQVKLEQAEAKLSEATAKLEVLEKQVDEKSSKLDFKYQELNSASAKLDLAEKDYTRYAEMYKEGIVSKQEYDKSLNQLTVAQANKNAADENIKTSKAAFDANKASVKSQEAEIKKLEAEVEQAKINLSNTKVYASEDGTISERTVEKGMQVHIAQPMFSLVPQRVWVVANFKEVQIANMKKGQRVWIKVDTYPHKKFKGYVDSIQRATGEKSSLKPSENPVQSNVKIVQKVPVRIMFDEDISGYNIVPGMRVGSRVKVK